MSIQPRKSTLDDLQKYVLNMELERGFIEQDAMQKSLLLGEEVGELYKAIRKNSKMKVDVDSKVGAVDEELADILIYVCAIANRFEIDLEKAFWEKEHRNRTRIWQ
mgnify:CR=1 FL=1